MKDTEEFSKEGLPLPKIFTAEGSSCLAEQCNVFNSRELNLGDFETLKGDSSQAIAQGKRKLKKKKKQTYKITWIQKV
jgi:ABC-type proline/glycine betaine transport system substrate-binding protein